MTTNKQEMIDYLIQSDVEYIKNCIANNDTDYLRHILKGDNFVGYANRDEDDIIDLYTEINDN